MSGCLNLPDTLYLPPELWDSVYLKTDPETCFAMKRFDLVKRFDTTSAELMTLAIKGGHIGYLQYLRGKGGTFSVPRKRVFQMAAEYGHLEMVKWLHSSTKRIGSKGVMDVAATNGHLDVVKWLHKNRGDACTRVSFLGRT